MNGLVLVFQKKAWGARHTQSEKEDNMSRTAWETMPYRLLGGRELSTLPMLLRVFLLARPTLRKLGTISPATNTTTFSPNWFKLKNPNNTYFPKPH